MGTSKNAVAPLVVATALAALLAGILACGGAAPTAGGHGDGDSLFPRLPKVTGHIDLVEPDLRNPRHFRALRVTDSDGRRWVFVSEGWVGVSVGHLKDHQIQGHTVTVWYEPLADGGALARFVGD